MDLFRNRKVSGCYSQRISPTKGTGLYASHELEPEHPPIKVDYPLVTVLDSARLEDTCYDCHFWKDKFKAGWSYGNAYGTYTDTADEEKKLQACGRCHVVKFCSKGCQKYSWKKWHRLECPIFERLHPRVLPTSVRAVIRLLLMQSKDLIPPDLWNALKDLESHEDDFRREGPETWENLCLMATAAKEYSGTTQTLYAVTNLFCKLMINSFTLTTPNYDPVGLVLDPFAARLNHSCNYNATVRFSHDASFLEIVPLRGIEPGKEICVSYIDANQPFARRQKELRERYFFTCNCELCQKGDDTICDAFIENTTRLSPDYLKSTEQRAVDLLEAAKKDQGHTAPIHKLKYGLHILRETSIWPLHRFPYSNLRHQLVLTYIDAKQFHSAFIHAAIIHLRIDPIIMEEEHHPIRMVHSWLLVRLIGHMMEGNNWAAQKEELHSEKLNLAWLRCDLLKELKAQEDKVGSLHPFMKMVYAKYEEMRYSGAWSRYEHAGRNIDVEWDRVEFLIDEALRKEEQWGNQ